MYPTVSQFWHFFSIYVLFEKHADKYGVEAGYKFHFEDPEEEIKCDALRFKKITEYRRLSPVPLNWESANACCKKKGMILHTPERDAEKEYLYKTLVGEEESKEEYWGSANGLRKAPMYTWEFGTNLDIPQKDKGGHKLEGHTWGEGEKEKGGEAGDCVSIVMWPEKKGLKLIKNECTDEKKFICQLQTQISGRDLTSKEMETCNKKNLFVNLPGADTYKFGMTRMRWKLANYCCQERGWSLAGNLKPKNSMIRAGLQKIIGDIDRVYMWTSLNDFCVDRDFRWACGKGYTNASSWRDANPDNWGLNEDCGQYYWAKGDKDEIFYANDLYCDSDMNFICETYEPCPRNKQYHCPHKPPTIMNPEDNIIDDEAKCAAVQFSLYRETDYAIYYISDTEMTWSGAMNCLDEKDFVPASYQEDGDIEFFNSYILEEADPKDPKAVWNTATSWRRSHHDVSLKWEDGTKVSRFHLLPFHTNDNIDPICGKTTVFKGTVGIMTENCLRNLKFFYKISKAAVPNILPIHVCPKRTGIPAYRATCPNTLNTVNPRKPALLSNSTNLTITPRDEEILTKIRFQNAILKNIVVDFAMDEPEEGSNSSYSPFSSHLHHPHRGFKLLSTSVGIYSRICPKVPGSLLVKAFQYFHYLHWITSQGRTELVTAKEYKWNEKLLHRCLVNSTGPRFRTDACDELILAKDKCPHHICVERELQFNIQRKDPLLEIMWKVFELVQSVCFSHFEESYLMWHKYGQGILDLWSPDLQIRWFNQIESNTFWERVLGPLYEVHLLNMDKCNWAVIPKHLNVHMRPQTMPYLARVVGVR